MSKIAPGCGERHNEAVTSPRRRLSIAERRRQIAEHSVELVARYGSYGVTMQHVADAVGLTLPGLLHHVRNRDDLLAMLIELQFDQDPAETSRSLWDDETITLPQVLRGIVARNAGRPELTALYLLLAVEARDPAHPAHTYYADRHARIVDAFVERPWSLPERFRDKGALADLVRASLSALDGVQLQAQTDPREGAEDLWSRVERAFFGGSEWDGYR